MTFFLTSTQKIILAYAACTMLAIFFDLIQFLVAWVGFARQEQAYEETLMLILCAGFLALDFYYYVWLLSLKLKLPDELGNKVQSALVGQSQQLLGYLRQLRGG